MDKLPDGLERMRTAIYRTSTLREEKSTQLLKSDIAFLQARLRSCKKFKEAAYIHNLSNRPEEFKQWLLILIKLCKEIARDNSDPDLLVRTSDKLLAIAAELEAITSLKKYEQKVLLEICSSLGTWHNSFARAFTEHEAETACKTLPSSPPTAFDQP